MPEVLQNPANYQPYSWQHPYGGPFPCGPYFPPVPTPWNPSTPPLSIPDVIGGTRSLSPTDFSNGVSPTNPVNHVIPIQSSTISFSDTDRVNLKKVLDILKTFPGGVTSKESDKVKLATMFGFLSGFFEAKGVTRATSVLDDFSAIGGEEPTFATHYDTVIKNLELLITGNSDTRIAPVVAAAAIVIAEGVVACAVWDGIKTLYRKATE
jgi:hypothetical protein